MSNYFWSFEKAAAEIKKDRVLTASVRETRERAAFDLSDKARCMYSMCPAWTMRRTLFHSNAPSQHLTIDWCLFTQIIESWNWFYIAGLFLVKSR